MAKKQLNETEIVNMETGEITKPELNQVLIKETLRSNGSRRIQQDFSNCPTLAEQHTAHLTNINYLISKYKPDELQAYINARDQHRKEIVGHDFSQEPDLQGAKNIIYQSKQAFEALPDETKQQFRSHLEFLKFIDNPANAEKMLKLGILTLREIQKIQIPEKGKPLNANAEDADEGEGRQGEGKK